LLVKHLAKDSRVTPEGVGVVVGVGLGVSVGVEVGVGEG